MHRVIGSVLAVWLLAGCGSLGAYDDTALLVVAGPEVSPVEAVRSWWMGPPRPYRIVLEEADPGTGEPVAGAGGLSASGVGGLFLPLRFDWTAAVVEDVRPTERGVAFTARLESEVNLIPTWQGRVRGAVEADDRGAVRLRLRPFYANWAVIGNVIAGGDLSLARIDRRDQTFRGTYRVMFFGTGNATGSGHYRATLGAVDAVERVETDTD
ncbi:MAG: hypothetical protein AAF800_13000 [Planctomycetota bacterium]